VKTALSRFAFIVLAKMLMLGPMGEGGDGGGAEGTHGDIRVVSKSTGIDAAHLW
jgi:hypothetical protein